MGSDIKKTVVLDFYGVPGSGKSTISHKIAENYRRKGISAIEASYDLDHGKLYIIRKIVKLLMLITLPEKKRKAIKELVKQNGYNRSNGNLKQIVNIASKLYAISKFNGHYDFLIFDEGFAQAAISLSVNSKIPAEENLKQIIDLIDDLPEIRLINIRVNPTEALKRLEIRNSGDTRVEAMKTEQEKIVLMKSYEIAADQISRVFSTGERTIYN